MILSSRTYDIRGYSTSCSVTPEENITSVHKDLNNFLSHHFCFLPGTYILYRYYIRPCFTMIPPGFNEVQCMWYVSFVLLKAFGTILDWDRHSECQPL